MTRFEAGSSDAEWIGRAGHPASPRAWIDAARIGTADRRADGESLAIGALDVALAVAPALGVGGGVAVAPVGVGAGGGGDHRLAAARHGACRAIGGDRRVGDRVSEWGR